MPDLKIERQDRSDLLAHVVGRIRPVAERMCKANNPTKSSAYCNLNVKLSGGFGQAPRATFSVQSDGKPIITLNQALLNRVENADELGFVIAHEAGHQISDHFDITTSGRNGFGLAQAAGQSSFALQTVNLKRLELEADAIGTIIAFKAGFDPISGSKALHRFTPDRRAVNYTHPELEHRDKLVRATVAQLESGAEITF